LTADGLTEEQSDFRASVKGIVTRHAPPEQIAEFERAGEISGEVWRALAANDLLGVGAPVSRGGSGGGALELAIVVRELASASLSLAMRYLASAYSGVQTLIRCGSEEQCERLLVPFFRGEIEFGFGFTEPSGGADSSRWRTAAVQAGEGWTLNGTKTFTSNADHADQLLILARTSDDERRLGGFTIFLVPPRAPGVTVRRIETMGLRAEGAFEVNLEAVEVGPEAVLGVPGEGFYAALASLDMERIMVAAAAVGNAGSGFDEAIAYARDREAFGRPIGSYQAVQHHLADAACEIEAAWLLTLKAARSFDADGAAPLDATMAKYVASENAFQVIHRGMRVLGGYGFTQEFQMERRFRDAQLFLTGPISSEMARNFIGERLGLPKSY
jgi:acyl-CoA dehydrogenase